MSPYVPMTFLLFIISTLIFSTSHGVNITVPLIYRDSVYSPLYNAFETIADRALRVTEASHARHEYLSSLLSNDDVGPQGSKLVPGKYSSLFFVNFTIGDPPLPQLALVDSGSPILWLRSKPCVHEWRCIHLPGDPDLYDPSKSRTSYKLPCLGRCDKCIGSFFSKYCKFEVNYVDGTVIQGNYVTDELTFLTSRYYQFTVTVTNNLFGCTTDTTPPDQSLDFRLSGIMGLAPYESELLLGYPSLVSKLGSKFSYCVGLLSDLSYPYNEISFGGAANLFGPSTPFVGTNYYVRIVHISIGGKMLDTDPQEFQNMSRKQGISVDSGTEFTFLPSSVLVAVREEVQKAAFFRGMEEVVNSTRLVTYPVCYKGTVDKEAHGFPPLGFHFQDGAQLQVKSVGLCSIKLRTTSSA